MKDYITAILEFINGQKSLKGTESQSDIATEGSDDRSTIVVDPEGSAEIHEDSDHVELKDISAEAANEESEEAVNEEPEEAANVGLEDAAEKAQDSSKSM